MVHGAGPHLVGFVRNPAAGSLDDYPWPVPVAHFLRAHVGAERRGEWLERDEAEVNSVSGASGARTPRRPRTVVS